ncbi:unnamed protein product [Ceratitis capitata]|uniref:(Mediterranean fruit fly) hypothetical protein n=1 Tax=Ceratitis capitata TaxID=7213 RepID=A0A811VJ97_CERCA|nr:unnamed protein product [Ceratitis capitata]
MSYITGSRTPLHTRAPSLPVICFMNSAPFAPVKRHPELNFETQKVDWFLFQLCDIKFNGNFWCRTKIRQIRHHISIAFDFTTPPLHIRFFDKRASDKLHRIRSSFLHAV